MRGYISLALADRINIFRREREKERYKSLELQKQLTGAYSRFVPHSFLSLLDKNSILDIQLGDNSSRHMTILFSDIRLFTQLSENMSPYDNFAFINSYLEWVGPVVRDSGGFILKYIGDAIMAVFPKDANSALIAAIMLLEKLMDYNAGRERGGYRPISIGIGLNSGPSMLGTIGEHTRMDATVIGDAVNLASRIENLTKFYGVPLIVGESTNALIHNRNQFSVRYVDSVRVKGKDEIVQLYEVFNADLPHIKSKKIETMHDYDEGIKLYVERAFKKALMLFTEIYAKNPDDGVVKNYITRLDRLAETGVDDSWDGITTFTETL